MLRNIHKTIANIILLLALALSTSSAWAVDAGNGEGGVPPGGGTISNPAVLTIGTSYTGSISAAGSIYYKFTTSNHAFTHTVSMGSLSSNYTWLLFSDAAYTNLVEGCSGYGSPFSCTTDNLNPQATYYLKVSEFSIQSDTYNIKVDVNIGSEGTYSEPVNLTVGSPYLGAVKKKWSINGASYYKFTTTNAGYHSISLSGATTDLKWELNSHNSGLYPELIDCDVVWDVGDESCSTTLLDANKTYYLIVENAGTVEGTFFTVNITEGGEPQPVGADEGSMVNPVTLIVDTAHTGTVATSGTSYYKFATGNEVATHLIRINRKSTRQQVQFYLDPGFTVLEKNCYLDFNNFSDGKCPITYLDANTTYYFSLRNMAGVGDIYSISVLKNTPRSPDSEGTTITPVVLTVDALYAGKVGASDQSFYKFTATEARPYRISLTGSNYRLHWIAKRDWNDLFSDSSCHTTSPENGSCVTGRFDVGQTVYFYVWNDDQSYSDTYNLLVQVEYGLSEGTQNTPISLTPGTPHSGSVAASETSYYQFTTGSNPQIYTIALTGLATNADWHLKKVGDLNNTYNCWRFSDTSDEICKPQPLEANTTYRIAVTDRGNLRSDFTLHISSGEPPTTLTLGQPYSESVAGYTTMSYYKFTTGPEAALPYTISMLNASHRVHWLLYTQPLFQSGDYIQVCDGRSGSAPFDESCTNTSLLPNTTYYVLTYIYKYYGESASYDIVVNTGGGDEGSIAAPISLELSTVYAGTVGQDGRSYYSFTTGGGGPKTHLISLTGMSSDLTWWLYRNPDFSDLIKSCNSSLTFGDEICETPSTLKANTPYYLLVHDYDGYSGGFQLNIVPQKKGGRKK